MTAQRGRMAHSRRVSLVRDLAHVLGRAYGASFMFGCLSNRTLLQVLFSHRMCRVHLNFLSCNIAITGPGYCSKLKAEGALYFWEACGHLASVATCPFLTFLSYYIPNFSVLAPATPQHSLPVLLALAEHSAGSCTFTMHIMNQGCSLCTDTQ